MREKKQKEFVVRVQYKDCNVGHDMIEELANDNELVSLCMAVKLMINGATIRENDSHRYTKEIPP